MEHSWLIPVGLLAFAAVGGAVAELVVGGIQARHAIDVARMIEAAKRGDDHIAELLRRAKDGPA